MSRSRRRILLLAGAPLIAVAVAGAFCVILAAVITPTPDIYNMTLMCLPLLGLYFISFGIVLAVDRARRAGQGRG